MKINVWKFTTFALLTGIVCITILSSFKISPGSVYTNGDDPNVLTDRAQVRELYNNFVNKYSESKFKERSGTISKSTLQTLLNNMRDESDQVIYYYMGRTNDSHNVIMLFNDPQYNDINEVTKFVTVAPFCPPNCLNTQINDYVTTDN